MTTRQSNAVVKDRLKNKGQKTHQKILQAAIQNLAQLGYAKTTFQSIADHCGLSQPLVVHYFKNRENVFPAVINYIVTQTKDVIAITADPEDPPSVQLRKFIRLSLTAVRKDDASAKVILTLNFLAAFEERFQESSAQIKHMVTTELSTIISAGNKTKEFRVKDIAITTRLLTAYITGVRMSMLNEKLLFADDDLIRLMEEHCLKIVGASV